MTSSPCERLKCTNCRPPNFILNSLSVDVTYSCGILLPCDMPSGSVPGLLGAFLWDCLHSQGFLGSLAACFDRFACECSDNQP